MKKRIGKPLSQKLREKKISKALRGYKIPKVSDKMFPDEEWAFWLAHGINYLISDYSTGNWTPMFPEIYMTSYPGRQVLSVGDLTKKVFERFISEREINSETGADEIPGYGKAAMAWMMCPKEQVYIYYQNVLAILRKNKSTYPDGAATLPHQPLIWDFFNNVMEHLGKKGAFNHI